MELSGCYFLFIRWVLYKTHPGPSPGSASHWVGIDDTCFIHSFVLQYLWTPAMCRALMVPWQTWSPSPRSFDSPVAGSKSYCICFENIS